MFEIIQNVLTLENNLEIRKDCLRLLGCLGAIDNFYYKKILNKIQNLEIIGEKLEKSVFDIVEHEVRWILNIIDKKKRIQNLQNENFHSKKLIEYY
jgi:FKBP12-rapamycin complex-associated protein